MYGGVERSGAFAGNCTYWSLNNETMKTNICGLIG